MIVKDIIEKFQLEPLSALGALDNEIKNVYIGDLLSWVMGRAKENCAWITIQGHVNIIAVATLVNAACIIVCENAEISADTIEKAESEEIPLLKSKLNSYELAKLFAAENL